MLTLKCLRCGTDMEYAGREKFQLGEERGYTGILAVMTSQSMLLDIYKCPECGKVELFEPPVAKPVPLPRTNWICSQCGFYNNGRVQSCQECGVTRAWSDDQRKKE